MYKLFVDICMIYVYVYILFTYYNITIIYRILLIDEEDVFYLLKITVDGESSELKVRTRVPTLYPKGLRYIGIIY